MRRFASVVLTAALTMGAMGAMATSADAATTKKWDTKNGYKALKAGGKYKKNSTKVVINGWLWDTKNNGWSPAVQFMAREKGKKDHYSNVFYFRYGGKPADFAFKRSYGRFFSSTNTADLYVREAGVKESNPKKIAYGPWKKLY